MGRVLCWFGLHEWRKWVFAPARRTVYHPGLEADFDAIRYCDRCRKYQTRKATP